MQHHRFEVLLSLVTVVAVAGCAAAPRARPLPTERVEEGPNSRRPCGSNSRDGGL